MGKLKVHSVMMCVLLAVIFVLSVFTAIVMLPESHMYEAVDMAATALYNLREGESYRLDSSDYTVVKFLDTFVTGDQMHLFETHQNAYCSVTVDGPDGPYEILLWVQDEHADKLAAGKTVSLYGELIPRPNLVSGSTGLGDISEWCLQEEYIDDDSYGISIMFAATACLTLVGFIMTIRGESKKGRDKGVSDEEVK